MKYLSGVSSLEFDIDKCNGCKMCTEVCPHAVFKFINKRSSITDKDLCMECGACAINCESGAISVKPGVGCAAAIINSMLYGGEPSCDCSGTTENKASVCC